MMKLKKLLYTVLIVVTFALFIPEVIPAFLPIAKVEAASNIKMSKKNAVLIKGETIVLSIIGTSKKVSWSTSNKSVVTVNSQGKITAKGKGSAIITATLNKSTFKCNITVEEPKLSESKISIEKGKAVTLKVKETSQKIIWSSENKSIATVNSNGKISGKKVGSTKIVASVGKKKYYCKVTVLKSGQYDSTLAYKNISYTITPIWNGVIAEVINSSSFPVYVNAKVTFLNASGKIVANQSDINPYLEAGRKCILFFEIPYGKTFDRYKLSYSTSKPTAAVGNASKIKLTATKYPNGVLVDAENESSITIKNTRVTMLYYKDGKVIYADSEYPQCNKPKAISSVAFLNAVDSKLNYIAFDEYKLYVDYSY